jgi:hypothetical protein
MTINRKIQIAPIDEDHLQRMLTIVSGNVKATAFVKGIWEDFSCRVKCEIIEDDGKPSVIRYNSRTRNGLDVSDIHLILRKNNRLEEALIHELLHADLYRRGYPKFFLSTQDVCVWQEGADILNLADHLVMLPGFVSLGYAEERFVGPSKPMNEEGQQVEADLRAMEERLSTKEGYAECLSEYLRKRGIKFEIIPSTIVQSRP